MDAQSACLHNWMATLHIFKHIRLPDTLRCLCKGSLVPVKGVRLQTTERKVLTPCLTTPAWTEDCLDTLQACMMLGIVRACVLCVGGLLDPLCLHASVLYAGSHRLGSIHALSTFPEQ